MRPASVRSAEWLYLASILLTIMLAALGWDQAVEVGGVGVAFGINAVIVGFSLLVLLLTTRRGSTAALWVLVVLTALNLIGYLWQVWNAALASGLFGVVTSAQTALTLVATVLLFRPRAREWFQRLHALRHPATVDEDDDPDAPLDLGKGA